LEVACERTEFALQYRTRTTFWELAPLVCDLAALIAPDTPLRTLDALHLDTYFLARRKVEGLDNLTADIRLEETAKQA
jgi:hypothetical protein